MSIFGVWRPQVIKLAVSSLILIHLITSIKSPCYINNNIAIVNKTGLKPFRSFPLPKT